MRCQRFRWMPLWSCTLLIGCDSTPPTVPLTDNSVAQAQQGTAKLPDGTPSEVTSKAVMLDHPEYANWSRFPEGTSITRMRTATNEFGEVTVTTRMWLASKSQKEVEVGSQVDVQRPNEPLEKNPDRLTKYPAQFQLPEGMDPNFFSLPTAKAKKIGDEIVTVDGREVTAEIFEWEESNEAGPMAVKLWRSIDVPGRIVRQEMITRSSQTKTIENVEVFKIPSLEDAGGN